jgi:hypothetical protein
MTGAEDKIKQRIKLMTREQKFAEFGLYLTGSGVLNLDVDRIMADQAALGAPDSVLDDALLTCAKLAGSVLGRESVSAQDFVDALKTQGVRQWLQDRAVSSSFGRSQLDLRKSRLKPRL